MSTPLEDKILAAASKEFEDRYGTSIEAVKAQISALVSLRGLIRAALVDSGRIEIANYVDNEIAKISRKKEQN